MLTKQQLIAIMDRELDDRLVTQEEGGGDTAAERLELKRIQFAVENEQPLCFSDYSWLCDLVSTAGFVEGEEFTLSSSNPGSSRH